MRGRGGRFRAGKRSDAERCKETQQHGAEKLKGPKRPLNFKSLNVAMAGTIALYERSRGQA
jgi:tRNA(Leu) C34 or U34 (ribose-2'-O)-methylase TrmL